MANKVTKKINWNKEVKPRKKETNKSFRGLKEIMIHHDHENTVQSVELEHRNKQAAECIQFFCALRWLPKISFGKKKIFTDPIT